MLTKITGKITSIFPDDINTDDIIPAWTLQEAEDQSFFKKYAFYNYDQNFVKRCKKEKTNIIIAGKNFGCGSSREQAIYALKQNNVVTVIAKSYPDIFYRNALNNGLILITIKDISSFKLNDLLTIDLKKKVIIFKEKIVPFIMSDEETELFSLQGKFGQATQHLKQILTGRTKTLINYTKQNISSNKPQTIVEKIVSDHLGRSVSGGEKIDALPVDILFFNEVIGSAAIRDFLENFSDIYKKLGQKVRVFDPKKIFFIPDHTVPSSSVSVSEGITFMEDFARQQGIYCYKEGDGIEHVVLMEDGYIVPGEIILGTDSHTDTNGALNALALGVGTTDAVYALATGFLYDFEVPQTIRVNLNSKLPIGVYAKDLILYLIKQLGTDGANRKIVEFGGPALRNLCMDARTTVANMTVETGGRSAIFESDFVLEKYIRARAKFPYKPYLPDKNCHYEKVIEVDLSKLEPCVAFPHKPDNVTFISQRESYMKKSQQSKSADFAPVYSLKITDAFLGGCTNGRYEDFLEAAKTLKGKKVHKNINFVAIPASRKIYNKLLREKILQIFAEAGVNIESPNCGPCFGKHMGVIGSGAQMISSSNRNYIGRMGSKDAKIFLASPATVAASAVVGEIVDPRRYL